MMRSIRITMMAVLVPLSSLFLLAVGVELGRIGWKMYSWYGLLAMIVAMLPVYIGFALFLGRFFIRKLDQLDTAVRYYHSSVAQLSNYADSSRNLIAEIRYDGLILSLNSAGKRMLGVDDKTEEQWFIHRFLPGEHGEALRRGMQEARQSGLWTDELELLDADGRRVPVSMTLAHRVSVRDGTGCFGAIASDLSDRRSISSERTDERQVERSARAKSEWLAKVGHELRTPLHAVIGLANLIDRTELSDTHREYLDQIDASSRHLLRMLNDLLDFSKLEAGKLALERTPFSLEELVRRMNDTVRVLLGCKPVDLLVSVDPDIPATLIGDPGRLEQVLLNLLGNAVKFTERGEIEFSIALEENKETETGIVFTVRDTGIGMTEQQMARMFEPFEQSDSSIGRKYGGTGLGLAIAKSIVELMGSRLEATSAPGVGTEFRFRLRLKTDRTSSAPLPRLPCRVLVVEDHSAARERLLADLAPLCAAADGAASLAAALAATRNSRYDVLILDMESDEMRRPGAWTACRTLCRERGILVAAYTTLYGQQALQKLDDAFKPDAVLIKPADRRTLHRTLRQLIAPESRPHEAPALPQRNAVNEPLPLSRVLLVDDHEISQTVASKMMERLGCHVVVASSGLEALHILRGHRFDLIVMDLHMPEMDGLTAVRLIRRKPGLDSVPIVMLTADTTKEQHQDCLNAGAQDVLIKPVETRQLRAVLSRWLGPGRQEQDARGAVSSSSIPPLEGLDIRTALSRLDGREDVYLHLLRKFRDNYVNITDTLAVDIETGNFKMAAQRLHTLRGSSSHLSATEVYEAATRLETALKEADERADLAAYVRELEERLQVVFYSISKFEKSISLANN